MVKKDAPMDRLGEVLSHSLKRLELTPRLDEYGVWPIWNEVVGKAIANNAQPEKIRNGTLFVKVTSPVWMQQLQFMKEMIAGKLNERLKSEVVKSIFFMVGRIDAPATNEAVPDLPKAIGRNTPPEVNEEFLDAIDDPEIRAAFQKLLKSVEQRKSKSNPV